MNVCDPHLNVAQSVIVCFITLPLTIKVECAIPYDTLNVAQVEQYYQQLPKPLLVESSSTVAFSEHDKDERSKTMENIKSNVVKINPKHLRRLGGGPEDSKIHPSPASQTQITPKSVSMERTILMRTAQLQMEHLKEKFDSSALLYAKPSFCLAQMVRVQVG